MRSEDQGLTQASRRLFGVVARVRSIQLLLLLALLARWSQAGPEITRIDIREKKDDTGRYAVAFCARPAFDESLFGHAFVTFGKEDHERLMSVERAFGLYPKSEGKTVLSILGSVPGNIVDETTKGKLSKTTVMLVLRVDADQYRTAETVRKLWALRGEYSLVQRDCVTFVGDVARMLRLKTPVRREDLLPVGYVEELVALNSSKEVAAEESSSPAPILKASEVSVKWAQRHLGQTIQPCGTDRCRYNPDSWSPDACRSPDPAPDEFDRRHDLVTEDGHVHWYLNCARFVRMAFGQGAQGNADQIYKRVADKSQLRTTSPVPRGAVVFWRPKTGAGFTHIAIALGEGQVIHTGAQRGSVRTEARTNVLPDHGWGWCDPAAALGWTQRQNDARLAVPGAARVAAGASHVLLLDERGTLCGWGANDHQQISPLASSKERPFPARVPGREVVAIAAGDGFSLALDKSGAVWQWGRLSEDNTGPVSVLARAKAVACGKNHALVAGADGVVRAWGRNISGQIGDGKSGSKRPEPVEVLNVTGAVAVAAGNHHSVALDSSGQVWTWGGNRNGQLGRKGKADVPERVPDLRGVTAIAAGGSHTAALTETGAVWTWGYNWQEQLGTGGRRNRLEPDVVRGLPRVVAIACGQDHTIALGEDGNIYCWGDNRNGELGDGKKESRTTPNPVAGLPKLRAIAAGARCTFAVGQDGSVWAWGNGWNGELGGRDRKRSATPVPVWGFSSAKRGGS